MLGDKALRAIFDNAGIKRFVPEFASTIPFREGIMRTLAWFEADLKHVVVNSATHEKMNRTRRSHEDRHS